MGYRFYTATAPLYRFELAGRLSAEETDQYFADTKGVLDTGRPHAVVIDTTAMLVPEVEFVRRQANWLRDNLAELRRLDLGVALVIRSSLIRGLLRAIMHFQEIPCPHALFEDVDEATTWAKERLTANSLRPLC